MDTIEEIKAMRDFKKAIQDCADRLSTDRKFVDELFVKFLNTLGRFTMYEIELAIVLLLATMKIDSVTLADDAVQYMKEVFSKETGVFKDLRKKQNELQAERIERLKERLKENKERREKEDALENRAADIL